MTPLSPSEMVKLIADLQRKGIAPTNLTNTQVAAIQKSISRYGNFLGQDGVDKVTEKLLDGIRSIANPVQVDRGEGGIVTEGQTRSSLRGDLTQLINRFSNTENLAQEIDLNFMIKTSTAAARGASKMIVQNDEDVLDEYPALELVRVYDRTVPRGFKIEKGSLIAVPDDDWPSRFRAAAAGLEDEDIIIGILDATGRMVALVDSEVWQNLGDGAGGYTDTLGNRFDPLAFNTGHRQEQVARKDAEALGLLEKGEKAEPVGIDFANLFSIPA